MGYTDLIKTSNFRVLLKAHKDIEFFCTEASIPGFTIGTLEFGHESMRDKRPGDSIIFNDLGLTVLCDMELKVYKEVYDALHLTHDPIENTLRVDEEVFDAFLFITTNKNNPIIKIHFFDAWIESFSDLLFTTTSTDENPISFTIGLKYNYYTMELA